MLMNNSLKEKYISFSIFRIFPSKLAKLKYCDQSFELCLVYCLVFTPLPIKLKFKIQTALKFYLG